MAAYVDIVLTWLLFLSLFPIAGFWLYRAYRMGVKKDYSLVALKRGVPAINPRKFILADTILHLLAGLMIVYAIYGVVIEGWHYNDWTALAGSTIWCKVIFSFIMGRHAHPPKPKKVVA